MSPRRSLSPILLTMAWEAVDVLQRCTDLLDDIKQFKGGLSHVFQTNVQAATCPRTCRIKATTFGCSTKLSKPKSLQSKRSFQKRIALTDRLWQTVNILE